MRSNICVFLAVLSCVTILCTHATETNITEKDINTSREFAQKYYPVFTNSEDKTWNFIDINGRSINKPVYDELRFIQKNDLYICRIGEDWFLPVSPSSIKKIEIPNGYRFGSFVTSSIFILKSNANPLKLKDLYEKNNKEHIVFDDEGVLITPKTSLPRLYDASTKNFLTDHVLLISASKNFCIFKPWEETKKECTILNYSSGKQQLIQYGDGHNDTSNKHQILEVSGITGNFINTISWKNVGGNIQKHGVLYDNNMQKKLELPQNWFFKNNGIGEGIALVYYFDSNLKEDEQETVFGAVNSSGEFQFTIDNLSYMDPFCNGLARIEKQDENNIVKYGFVDVNGKIVISPIYSEATCFHNEKAFVRTSESVQKSKVFQIDRTGKHQKEITKGTESLSTLQRGIGISLKKDELGLFNLNGRKIWTPNMPSDIRLMKQFYHW